MEVEGRRSAETPLRKRACSLSSKWRMIAEAAQLESTMASDNYFTRFGFCDRQIAAAPHPHLGLVAVIPCFNEPDLIGALDSLWACERPGCAMEVIVAVNCPAGSSPAIRAQNELTLREGADWASDHRDPRFRLHLLHFPELSPKQAGVGLARKIGMDEAARRFDDLHSPEGIITGYDADCRCARNYLVALEQLFAQHATCPGCSVYFEHPLDGPLEPRIYEAVAAYELHLRYYLQALRFAGFPFAHHTIGSCMAVRTGIYKKQGGMNRRQAGEDFYFLQKIIPLGGFVDLTTTTVFPSPRLSERVPFGTGKAIRDYLERGFLATYPLRAILDLKVLFDGLPALYRAEVSSSEEIARSLPEALRGYLGKKSFTDTLREIRGNTAGEAAFRKRFFNWFNAFQIMKFVHDARDRFYAPARVEKEAGELLDLISARDGTGAGASTRDLLNIYRRREREAGQHD